MTGTATVTLNVDESALTEFRRAAAIAYGRAKGHLGKAGTEALLMWARMSTKKSSVARALELLEKGMDIGYGAKKIKREDLYDRR